MIPAQNYSPAKKWLRRVGTLLLALFLLFNMVMALNAWKFTHYYDDPALRKPQPAGALATTKHILFGQKAPKRLNDSVPSIPFRKLMLKNNDGLELEAWHIMSKTVPVIYPGSTIDRTPMPAKDSLNFVNRGTIIMFHGQGSCKSAILREAYEFLKIGYDVFMIDFRAHGGSEGEQSTVGLKEMEDVRCAYAYVKERTKQEPILFGVSLGAATITRAIAEYDLHPTKVILEMPFGSLYDAVKGFMRIKGLPESFAPFLTFWGGTLNGEWGFSHQPSEFAKSITCPTLIQWGAHDPRVTKEEEETILAHLATKEKQLVIYESAAHESLCKKERDKWVSNVSRFLSEP